MGSSKNRKPNKSTPKFSPPKTSSLSMAPSVKVSRDATNSNRNSANTQTNTSLRVCSDCSAHLHLDGLKHEMQYIKAALSNLTSICNQLVADSSLTAQSITNLDIKVESMADELTELSAHWMSDKYDAIVTKQCQELKNSISTEWQDCLNKRKIRYWHFLQNSSKAVLYEEWMSESPSYIPLKFRPKYLCNETEKATVQRINVARERYKGEVKILKCYAESHRLKYEEIDDNFFSKLSTATQSPQHLKLLKQWWLEDINRNITISQQLWNKRRHFLISQQKLDLQSDDYLLKRSEDKRKCKFPARRDLVQCLHSQNIHH